MGFHIKKTFLKLLHLPNFNHTWALTFALIISLSLFLPIPTYAERNFSEKNILVFGDSLSAAYGIAQSSGWVALLQERLKKEKYNHIVINASVSGETTIGGKNRLEAQLKRVKPTIVMIELGVNDGLRGLPIVEMEKNLTQMIQMSQKHGAKVVLIGMKLPPNYGANYTDAFTKTYVTLSQQFKTALVSFMLEKIATEITLVQQDGLHPNEKAQTIILDNIWPTLKPMLKK